MLPTSNSDIGNVVIDEPVEQRSESPAANPSAAPEGAVRPPGAGIAAAAVDEHPRRSAARLRAARKALDTLLKKRHRTIAAAWAKRHLAIAEIRQAVVNEADSADEAAFYSNAYLRPLIALLRGAASGAHPAWSAVYLDERQRFLIPANIAFAANEALLESVLADDVADLVARLPKSRRDAARQLLDDLHANLTRKTANKPVNVLLIGDCIMTELRAFLVGQCRERQTDVRIRHQYLSFERGIELNVDDIAGQVGKGKTDIIALSFFTFEGLPLYRALLADAARLSPADRASRVDALIRIVRQIVSSLRANSDIPVLLHTACGLPLGRVRRRVPFIPALTPAVRDVLDLLNAGLRDVANGIENVVLIDEDKAIGRGGLRRAARYIVPRGIRKGSLFHTTEFGPMLAAAYAPIIEAFARLRKTKVLLVDFDNTLWKGVMADGDVVHDTRAQKILRKLREAGILLVALSKNDPQQIRWGEMHLQPDDFVLHKISWNQKVQSLGEAAQQLDVGIDTFTLIDDNPVERALISDRFPQVAAFDPTDNRTWDAMELMLAFPNTRETEESAKRTALYREAAHRREAMVAELDYPQMMRSLELKATWSLARPQDLNRVHELTQRTNQFNTTTRRRSPAEIKELIASPAHRVFVCSLGDRFGNLGVVGVVILELTPDAVVYDSVVMSCRAMGFGLELLLVRGPLDSLANAGRARLPARGLFAATERNEPAASLFEKAGFSFDAATSEWLLSLADPLPAIPEWLTVVNT